MIPEDKLLTSYSIGLILTCVLGFTIYFIFRKDIKKNRKRSKK